MIKCACTFWIRCHPVPTGVYRCMKKYVSIYIYTHASMHKIHADVLLVCRSIGYPQLSLNFPREIIRFVMFIRHDHHQPTSSGEFSAVHHARNAHNRTGWGVVSWGERCRAQDVWQIFDWYFDMMFEMLRKKTDIRNVSSKCVMRPSTRMMDWMRIRWYVPDSSRGSMALDQTR